MTRDEIKKIIDGITDDQLKAVLDINTADIGKAKQSTTAELTTAKESLAAAQKDLASAQSTIKELETKTGDKTALEAEIAKYKKADEERAAAEVKARETAEHSKRFDAVLGDRKFAHDYIRNGVFADFEKLITDEANRGKGDSELFDSLTKDKAGIFSSQNPAVNMGGAGNAGLPGNHDSMTDAEYYAALEAEKKGK